MQGSESRSVAAEGDDVFGFVDGALPISIDELLQYRLYR
jgi:hypothetical protein